MRDRVHVDLGEDGVAERAARTGGGGQLGDHLAIHLVEAVEAQIVVGHHDERRDEPAGLGVGDREPRHEGLATAVAAAQKLDASTAVLHQIELARELVSRLLDPDRERVEPALGHQTGAELVEDVLGVVLGQHHELSGSPRT